MDVTIRSAVFDYGDFGLVGKTYFHEPSIRIPLIVTDFRPTKNNCIDPALVWLLDLFPSLLDWAGLEPPPHTAGTSLGSSTAQRMVGGVTTFGMMIRSQRWKLVRYLGGSEALFDLENDPRENSNVVREFDDVRQRLDQALTRTLLEGMEQSNADKKVPEVKASPEHPFLKQTGTVTIQVLSAKTDIGHANQRRLASRLCLRYV